MTSLRQALAVASLAIMTAIALVVLERRVASYLAVPVSTNPQFVRPAFGPPMSLLPLVPRGAGAAGPPVPADPFSGTDFGPDVRTIQYRATFRAFQAMEGTDGRLYMTYYWPPPGTLIYDPDRFGFVTGGAVREVMSGRFLDLVEIRGRIRGYPIISIGNGSTPTGDTGHGLWLLDASGPIRTSSKEPSFVDCSLCDALINVAARAPVCVQFAAGELCQQQRAVTYSVFGRQRVRIPGAYLIGAGRHRFLISVFDAGDSGVWDLEGFAR
jgi:hypothetical protein